MHPKLIVKSFIAAGALFCSNMVSGCSHGQTHADVARPDTGPVSLVRVSLKSYGLPDEFFKPGTDTKCSGQIIGYRFVVWLDEQTIAVGFNTSPNCRQSPDRLLNGSLRLLTFDLAGALKAKRDMTYLADGNGEIVADGEGMQGPNGSLLVRIESVNLDKNGAHESKSELRLFDVNLKDVAQLDVFLEQTTFVSHAIVAQQGFTLSGPRTYSVLDGSGAKKTSQLQVDWPIGAMDRKFSEHGYAFTLCGQELKPGEYTQSKVIYAGAKFRCVLNVQGEDGSNWTSPLKDGETAALVGVLADGSVAGRVHMKGVSGDHLVVWKKNGSSEELPWLSPELDGNVDSATPDLSRYASFADAESKACNPIAKLLKKDCGDEDVGRSIVFDRRSQAPLVNRALPKNSRAALSPDGVHYASFEANELRIFSLGSPK